MTLLCILCLSHLLPGYFLLYLVDSSLTGQHVHLTCISLPLVATHRIHIIQGATHQLT